MASVGRIVVIRGLQSEKGKDLNECYGKVTGIKGDGRRCVLPFCQKVEHEAEVRLTPMIHDNMFALRTENVEEMVMTDKTSVHFKLYTSSLYMRLQATAARQGDDLRKFLRSRSMINRRMLFEELYDLEGDSMHLRAKAEYATLLRFSAEGQRTQTWKQDLERALQLLADVIRANVTDIPKEQLRYDCAVTLLELGRVHSALGVASSIDTSGDNSYAVTVKLELLDMIARTLRKENDNCEEIALGAILELNRNEPFALWNLAAYFGRRAMLTQSYNNYKKALEYGSAPKTVKGGSAPFQRRLSEKDREQITRGMQAVKLSLDGRLDGKHIVMQNEKQMFLMKSDSVGKGWCSREEEAVFDLLTRVD